MSVPEQDERRTLRFSSIEELEDELLRIDSAEREGRLQAVGNWTPGQIFNHLGAWIEFSYEGYPIKTSPLPLPLRLLMGPVMRFGRKWFLSQPFPPNFRIGNVEGGTYATEVVPFEEGLGRLLVAIERLKLGEPPRHESPMFGMLALEDVIQLTLRHAEVHLGCLRY